MDFKPADFYQRQTTLPEIGTAGQERLSKAKSFGGGLWRSGVLWLPSIWRVVVWGTLHLIDYDVVSVSNLHRQVFYKTTDIGQPKAQVLANHIKTINPFVNVSFSTEALSKTHVKKVFTDYDIVLDCTDSLPLKYLINDACVLTHKVLVYGSLYKFDGYVATFNALDDQGNRTANLRDAFPEMPQNTCPIVPKPGL